MREVLALITDMVQLARRRKAAVQWVNLDLPMQGILEAYGPKWQSAFTPLVAGLVTDAADFWQVKTGVAFDVRNLEAETWFTQYMFTFADPITKTGEKELRSVIQLGVIEGWSIPQMQSHIELTFQKWMGQAATGHVVDPAFAALRLTSARSELIARTETTRAMAYGSRQLYKDAGITHKEWLATPDSHTRPSHHAADGQVTKIDEPFTVGGYLMMQPGDTAQGAPVDEIANCRCTVLPVLDDPNSIDESVVQPEPVDWWNEDDGDIEDWVDDEQPDGLPAWEDLPEGDDFEDAPLPPVYTPPPKPVPVLETPDDAPPAPNTTHNRYGQVFNTHLNDEYAFEKALKAAGQDPYEFSRSMASWTGGGYDDIRAAQIYDYNQAQGISSSKPREYDRYIASADRLEAGLLQMPVYDGETWRQVSLGEKGLAAFRGGVAAPNEIIQNNALASYTRSLDSSYLNVSNGDNTYIHVARNLTGVSIENVSGIRSELEVLSPSTAAFRVTAVYQRDQLPEDHPLYRKGRYDYTHNGTYRAGYVIEVEEIDP